MNEKSRRWRRRQRRETFHSRRLFRPCWRWPTWRTSAWPRRTSCEIWNRKLVGHVVPMIQPGYRFPEPTKILPMNGWGAQCLKFFLFSFFKGWWIFYLLSSSHISHKQSCHSQPIHLIHRLIYSQEEGYILMEIPQWKSLPAGLAWGFFKFKDQPLNICRTLREPFLSQMDLLWSN